MTRRDILVRLASSHSWTVENWQYVNTARRRYYYIWGDSIGVVVTMKNRRALAFNRVFGRDWIACFDRYYNKADVPIRFYGNMDSCDYDLTEMALRL